MAVFYKYTIYQPFLMDYTVNYCDFKRKTVDNKLMEIIINFLSRFSNNTHNCPFTPPEKFLLKDALMDTDFIPKLLPIGEYRIDVEYKTKKNVRYALIQTFFETKSQSLLDFKSG